MVHPAKFDTMEQVIGLSRKLTASLIPETRGRPASVDGVTVGRATMSTNAPHGGEMHPDGDELLYLISGRAKVVFLGCSLKDIEMNAGDGLVIPQGKWHRVDIIEPCDFFYVTPGPNNQIRPIADDA